jgi:hypothetical protein
MRDDPEALDTIRHDAAHVLAEAVQELFPGTQVTIGPNGRGRLLLRLRPRRSRSRRTTSPRSKRR